MKKIGFLILGLALSAVSTLSANMCDPCCNTNDWCGGWSAHADYIYWSPRRCGLDYAIPEIDSAPRGRVFEVDPDYSSGFRVGLQKCICDWELGVEYTRLHTKDSDSVFSPGGELRTTRVGVLDSIIDFDLAFADADYRVDLDVIDLEVGRSMEGWCGACVRLFGGVKLAYIDQEIDVFYQDTDLPNFEIEIVKQTVDMDAYGLYVGFEGTRGLCQLCRCGELGLFIKGSYGLLVGDSVRKNKTVTFSSAITRTITNLRDQCSQLVENLNLAAGLSFDSNRRFCRGHWGLHLGYEFHLWSNTSDFLFINQNHAGSENIVLKNTDAISFDGLTVGLHYTY